MEGKCCVHEAITAGGVGRGCCPLAQSRAAVRACKEGGVMGCMYVCVECGGAGRTTRGEN